MYIYAVIIIHNGRFRFLSSMCRLIRTQVLNDNIHELCFARFNSIPFPQNFSEYSGPLQQFGIEPSYYYWDNYLQNSHNGLKADSE